MAAAPVISATSLASSLGIAVKNASPLLEALVERGIAIEVTHRSKRWLYGLKDLAPLREEVSPPCRTTPGRRRGRPPSESTGSRDCSRRFLPGRRRLAALNRPSLAARAQGVRISDLSRWMQEADGAISRIKAVFERLAILRLLYRVNQTGIRDQNGVGARGRVGTGEGGGWHAHRISAIVRARGLGPSITPYLQTGCAGPRRGPLSLSGRARRRAG
jgi:hypothetical protein